MVQKIKIWAAALLAVMAVTVNAQVTTSALGGKVIDENKEAVIGATVQAVHTPSGTRYGAITNTDGRYTIQGMRTGGPYEIEFSYIGYQKAICKDIYLELGNTFTQNVQMNPSTEVLDEIVVVADAKTSAGAAQNFSTKAIQNTATVDRNVYDVVQNMPMVVRNNGGLSFAGSNNRYNSFQIDGTVSNDVFGLSGTGTNGGQTGSNPIPLDAIQEIQVVVSPFDVRQSGFTGGGINAITKQGTNKLEASAYTYFTNENLYGKYSAIRDYAKYKMSDQTTRTFGGTLGGALIKNKLFYFISAEGKKETYPSSIYPGYTPAYLTTADAQKIADKYAEYTGNHDAFGSRDVDQKEFNLLARIDWNINDKNKLAIRYQHGNSYKDSYSPSATSYTFNNSGFRYNNKTNSIVAELNSHISEKWYNEARVSASFVRDHRVTPYDGPTVQIKNVRGGDGETLITANIGTEYSSGANILDQDVYTIEDNLSYYLGDHTLTFGTHNEIFRSKNLFLQAAFGSWYFDSLDDFLNDNPSQFRYKYTDPSMTGGDLLYAPTMKAGQFGFYAQDKWNISNNLELTYGLRFDIPVFFNSPTENAAFNQYAAANGLDANVGQTPSAKLMVSPRVGFRWYTDDSHKTLLRGGVGLFTGRVPFVWISNVYNNNGVEQKGTTIYKNIPTLTQYGKDASQIIKDFADAGTPTKPDIAVVDKSFKFPQVFRANLAWEQRLPGDVKMTLEGIYSKSLNNVYFENLALTQTGKVYAVPGVEASAAPLYSVAQSDYYSIIKLSNTNKGYSYVLSGLLEKSFHFGLNLSGSYTYTRSKSVNDGGSSVASSNWSKNYSVSPNSTELGFTRFDVPHRVVLQASYTTPQYASMTTTIAVTYNGFSGNRYSLIMNDASRSEFNGDGWTGNILLYIPTKEELNQMTFVDDGNLTAAEGKQAFEEWIENDSYAKNHRGQYAERFSNLSPWQHQIDLHLAQDIFYLKNRGSKIQITFDVMNFANMLNKKWGASYSTDWSYSPLNVKSVTNSADGKTRTATYSYNSNNGPEKSDISSRWHAQVGVKLTF